MSKFLASVNSLEEALQVADIGVDIIDLKQPAQGALGALDRLTIQQIVAGIGGRCPISATIGDLPMQPDTIFNAVSAMIENQVDFTKLGIFPGGDALACIQKLKSLSQKGHALIAVLFADTLLSFDVLETLQLAGFRGVMLDTMDKQRGSLCQLMPLDKIAQFVQQAHALNLLCGLAGSLALNDIPVLNPLQADYLGFRGALCAHHQRTASLDSASVRAVKHAINNQTPAPLPIYS